MGGFTLIELLIVISIVALLATIGAVSFGKIMTNARNLEAKTVMKGLEGAVKSYHTEYLRMPSAESALPTEDGQGIDTSDEGGRALLAVLLAEDSDHNPRGKCYWEAVHPKSSGAGYTSDGGLRDPWGEKGYLILMDYSGDGRIANPYGTDGEAPDLHTDVIVYCAGVNKNFEEGGSASSKKADDVKSWQQ